MRYILLIVPNWNYTDGGINSFNFDFALALGNATRHTIFKVICVSSHQTIPENVSTAQRNNVEVESLDTTNGGFELQEFVKLKGIVNKLVDSQFFYFVGHDALTGNIASLLCNEYPSSCSLVFHHMDYESYYAIKGDVSSDDLHRKFSIQTDVLNKADFVIGVGPKLLKSAINKTGNSAKVFLLVPGLQIIKPNEEEISKISAITFGRYDIRNDRLKQMALAARAFAEFMDNLEPQQRQDATLKAIGITDNKERQEFLNHATAGIAGYSNIVTLPYSTNRPSLFDDLTNSSVCLMLSVHEGFGLVGWEAIAAGVPLIVSKNTGLYHFISDIIGDSEPRDYGLLPIDILGSMDGNVNESDKEIVKRAYVDQFIQHKAYKQGILRLRSYLLEQYTWDDSAKTFLSILKKVDFQMGRDPHNSENILDDLQRTIRRLNKEASPQPVLSLKLSSNLSSLSYLSRSVALSGREQEMTELFDFCNDEKKMSWWVIFGEGGTGKSRISLEFLLDLSINHQWYGGFLNGDTLHSFDWANWAPAFNTIIVIDYASRYHEKIQDLIFVLNEVATISPNKIRILLIDRNYSGELWGLLNYNQSRGKIPKEWKEPVVLNHLEDWAISHIIANYIQTKGLRRTISEVFSLIKHRPKYNVPLYTIMLLEEILQSTGQTSTAGDVFVNFVQREEVEIWKNLIPDIVERNRQKDLISLVTIIGGIESDRLVSLRNKYGSVIVHENYEILGSLYLTDIKNNYIYPIEPDLLGEHFIVENYLNTQDRAKASRRLEDLLKIVWTEAPQASLTFFQRIIFDFPEQSFASLIFKPKKSSQLVFKKVWCSLQTDILAMQLRREGMTEGLVQDYKVLKEIASWNKELQGYTVEAIVKIMKMAVQKNLNLDVIFFKNELTQEIIANRSDKSILAAGNCYYQCAKELLMEGQIEQAEEFRQKLFQLATIDRYITSQHMAKKLGYQFSIARKREGRIKRAIETDLFSDVRVTSENVETYLSQAEAITTLVDSSIEINDLVNATHLFSRLVDIVKQSPSANKVSFLIFEQYSAKSIIKANLISGRLSEDLIREYNYNAIVLHPLELSLDCIVFWENNFEIFLRVCPEAEKIMAQLHPIFKQTKLPRGTWNFYWGCLSKIVRFHLENENIEVALQNFETIKSMFDYPEEQRDFTTASEVATLISLYFDKNNDTVQSREFYHQAKMFSELGGHNFDLGYSMAKILNQANSGDVTSS